MTSSLSSWTKFKGDIGNTGLSSYSVDPKVRQWTFTTEGPIFASPVFDSEGTVYIGSFDHFLRAISSSGSLIWKVDTGAMIQATVSLSESGSLFVCTNSSLQSYESSSGKLNWNFLTSEIPGPYKTSFSSPVVSGDKVYFSCTGRELYSTTFSGSLIWKYTLLDDHFLTTTPAINSQGDIIIGSYSGLLLSFSSSGSLNWQYQFGGSEFNFRSSPVVAPDGSIYIGGKNFHKFYGFYSNGTLKFEISMPDSIDSTISIGSDGTLYVGCNDKSLYAMDPSKGSIIWSFLTEAHVSGSPVVDKNGNIYIASDKLYALSPKGSLLWSFKTFNVDGKYENGYGSSPAIGPNGLVYVGSSSFSLFATNGISVSHSSSPTKNSFPLGAILGISIGVPFVLCLLFVIGFYFKRSPKRIDEIELNGSFNKSSRQEEKFDFDDVYNNSESSEVVQFSSNESMKGSSVLAEELRLQWSQVSLSSLVVNDAILGQGSFGTVVKARFKNSNGQMSDVAIKVLTRSSAQLNSNLNFKTICAKACREVKLMNTVWKKMIAKDSITQVYGIVEGILPEFMTKMFRLEKNEYGIGIVMSFHSGGSLETFIRENKHLSSLERLRILSNVAKCLAELHTMGVVHGDIKPDNILLSDINGSHVCLADFGLSSILEGESGSKMGGSTLQQTKNKRGTPIYCAPEMLVDPFNENFDETVARASRKTDMYAFGLTCHRVLSGNNPFSTVRTEATLCAQVHMGTRPSMEEIPSEISLEVRDLINSLWSKNRSLRKSSIESHAILFKEYLRVSKDDFDTVFLHDNSLLPEIDNSTERSSSSREAVKNQIYYHLVRNGNRVVSVNVNNWESFSVDINKNHRIVVYSLQNESNRVFNSCLAYLKNNVLPSKLFCIVSSDCVSKDLMEMCNESNVFNLNVGRAIEKSVQSDETSFVSETSYPELDGLILALKTK